MCVCVCKCKCESVSHDFQCTCELVSSYVSGQCVCVDWSLSSGPVTACVRLHTLVAVGAVVLTLVLSRFCFCRLVMCQI